jgi:polyhydroxyalkanoate synthesis regulator phasin
MNPESNAIKHYNKMQRENIDYTVYGTGRKVGAGESTPLYLPSGQYNDASFAEVNNIPFSIMGLQTEVPSKDTPIVTQGSQITKLVTMDFLEAGIPIDFELKDKEGNIIEDINERFVAWNNIETEQAKEKASPLYKEIANNQKLLEAKIEQGYSDLLNKLGITQTEAGFDVLDKDKLIKTLRDEILKREVNDNIIEALEGYKKGDVVLEATPAYQQIRNILYSIADKNVVRPKISGGMKVQIPSTLLESNRVEGKEFKDKKGNIKYSYTSKDLKFYKNKDGERVCEIMLSRWFDNEQTRRMTDKELLEYLNTTDEGQRILSGIGYRIPTQKQNSIDVFKIAKFLPKDFGDSVVVPSALVKKVGSDFDIDKLSIYLKNVFTDAKGRLREVPFLGYGEQAVEKFKQIAIENNDAEIYKQAKSINKSKSTYELFQSIVDGTADEYTTNKWLPIIADWFPEEVKDGTLDADQVQAALIKTIEDKQKTLEKLTDEELTEILVEQQANIW